MKRNRIPLRSTISAFCFLILLWFPSSAYSADSISVTGIYGLRLVEESFNYQISISDSFKLHNSTVLPQGLTLRYSAANKLFVLYGDAKIIFSTDTVSVRMGDSLQPGLSISNRVLQSVDLSITGSFHLNKLTLTPVNLTFLWTRATYQYVLFGDIQVAIENKTCAASLGTQQSPGILIDSGKITQIHIGVSGDVTLRSLSIKPRGLSISWSREQSLYLMYGDISVILSKDSLDADLGTLDDPGVIITNGILTKLEISLTADFTMRKLVFKPKALTFSWDEPSKKIRIYGDVLIKIENDSLLAALGSAASPGIEITNGLIDTINIAVTGNFALKSLSVKPDSLVFVYDRVSDQYKIFGRIELDIDKDTIKARIGDFENPGIVITNGIVEKIDVEISGLFKLKSLSIKPDSLTFIYDRGASQYKMFGAIEIDIESDTIKAQLGTESDPGVTITQGKLDHINISVTSHFELKKLTIETDSLGIEWSKSPGDNVYHFFGKVKIDIDTNKIAFDFGSRSAPGLILRNGRIDTLKISTTSDIYFGGFEAGTENLTVEYSNQLYHIYGKLFLKKMWRAEINLGTGPGSGVTLDLSSKPAKVTIEQADFELADIDLGPITIKDLKLSLEQNRVQEADLFVDLPPGWEVGAKMKFKLVNRSLQIDAIDISWEALDFKQAIEIPGTGAFVGKIVGGLHGIENPHEFKVIADMDILFGGPFTIKEVGEVSLLYLHAGTTISRSELTLTADALMGAFKKDGTWVSVLGDGHLTLDFKWGEEYSINGKLNIPSNPWTILKADLEAKLSQGGAFNAHIGVHLIVPQKVPIAGGHEFAAAEGMIHYDKYDTASFAAGWAKLNLGFYKWNGGVKYNFRSKDYTTLGSKEITKITATNYALSQPSPAVKNFREDDLLIEVNNDKPHFIQVKINMVQRVDSVYLAVTYPSYGYNKCTPLYIVKDIDSITLSGINISTIYTFYRKWLYHADSLVFYIMAPGYNTDAKATLPSGQYTISMYHYTGKSIIQNYEVHKIYDPPSADWTFNYASSVRTEAPLSATLNVAKVNYHIASRVYNNDSAKVQLFYTKEKNENGKLLKSVRYKDYFGSYPPNGDYLKIEGLDFPADITSEDSLFLYLIIDDGINNPYKSELQYVAYKPAFEAKVQLAGMPDSAGSGIEAKLYVQNPADGNFYNADTLDRFTNKSGRVSFPYCLTITTKIKYVFDIPFGYEVDPSSAYRNGEEILVDNTTVNCGRSVTMLLRKKDGND